MTPAEYVEIVVLPTVHEYMANTGDRRLAYLSAISVYHVTDYLMRAAEPPDKAAADTELRRIRSLLRSYLNNWYDAIEGMANGAKHCGRDAKRGAPFKPGDEEYVPCFGFGTGEDIGGFGEGMWNGPGLLVPVGGEVVFIDIALGNFLLCCRSLFPDHIPQIDPFRLGSANQAV